MLRIRWLFPWALGFLLSAPLFTVAPRDALAGDAERQHRLASPGLTDRSSPSFTMRAVAKSEAPADDFMSAGVLLSTALTVPVVVMSLHSRGTVSERRHARALGMLFSMPAIAGGLLDAFQDGHLRPSGAAQLTIGVTSLAFALLHPARAPRAPSGGTSSPAPRTAPVYRAGIAGEPQLGWAIAF